MCTITWRRAPDLYEIYFNRDALKTHPLPKPPELRQTAMGTEVLAPREAAADGGTWLSVNAHGLVLALLNLYPPHAKAVWSPRRNRGLLVDDLADCQNLIEVSTWLHEEDLEYYRPFALLAFHLDYPEPLWAEWKNPALDMRREATANLPITSSSYANRQVVAARKARFQEILEKGSSTDDAAIFRSFHHDKKGLDTAYAVCMDRPDARTVSYSEIRLESSRAHFRYHLRNRGTGAFEQPLELGLQLRHGIR